MLPSPVFLGFPDGSAGKESTCNAGDLGWIPGLGRSPGEGTGHPLQYSGLENSTDSIVPAVTKSRTQLSDFHVHFAGWGWFIPETMVQGKEAGIGLTRTSKANVRMMNPEGRGLCMTSGHQQEPACFVWPVKEHTFPYKRNLLAQWEFNI